MHGLVEMPMFSTLAEKIAGVRTAFAPLVGRVFTRVETAELLDEGGRWEMWPGLPVRLFADSAVVAVSWWNFDDLWLANDCSDPFSTEGFSVRWTSGAIPAWNSSIGATFEGVMIGRGEMSIGDQDVEIWTRLLIQVGGRGLEVFNALDENGYDAHDLPPSGEFVRCV